ncbi:M15 family metallopeptidase [Bacillus alveayuensis]|uniref:M15 family metallopeptidase n=1 Tax=Aeribacillus alveayuensis TaxID=279215 RepID=UPI0005D104A2|nr:M15 family metallopeptidase [Bacillus alveayuensis]
MNKWIITFVIILFILSGCQQGIEKKNVHEQEQTSKNDIEKTANESQQVTEQMDPNFLLEAQYFNEIKMVNGEAIIQNPDNVLVLVNKEFTLPSDYIPNDLTIPNVPFSFGDLDLPKRYMRKEAAKALEQLFAAASKNGINLYGVSAYRPYEHQQSLFNQEVSKKGKEEAALAVAEAGHSEHQTGLSIDVTSESVQFQITEKFGETAEGKWLAEHAHEFGFIIRYPKGKEQITKYQYEPWHIRYVGKKAAKVIYENEITFEEYFEKVKKI